MFQKILMYFVKNNRGARKVLRKIIVLTGCSALVQTNFLFVHNAAVKNLDPYPPIQAYWQ